MSGGHFDYKQYAIQDISTEIDRIIQKNDGTGELGYPDHIIDKFKEASHTLCQAAEMVQRVDWLLSGDDGEETFMARWKEETRPNWKPTNNKEETK